MSLLRVFWALLPKIGLFCMSHVWHVSCIYITWLFYVCMTHVIHTHQSCHTNAHPIENSRRDHFAKMKFTGQGTGFVRDVYIYPKKSPIYRQKSPCTHKRDESFCQWSLQVRGRGSWEMCIYIQKRALCIRKRALYTNKKDEYFCQRALYCRKALYGGCEVNIYTRERAQDTRQIAPYISAQKPYIYAKEPYISAIEMHVSAKEPNIWGVQIQVMLSVRCDIYIYIFAKEPDISAKETYISAAVTYKWNAMFKWRSLGDVTYIPAKEPDIYAKETYISAKETYISAKETYISSKVPDKWDVMFRGQSLWGVYTYLQKSPKYPQKRHTSLPKGGVYKYLPCVYISAYTYFPCVCIYPQKRPIYPQMKHIFLSKCRVYTCLPCVYISAYTKIPCVYISDNEPCVFIHSLPVVCVYIFLA